MNDALIERVQRTLFEDEEFNGELEAWCTDRCSCFDLDEDSEHKLEYTSLHEEFCRLFEAKITRVLESDGASVEEFWQKLTKAADGDDDLINEGFLLQCLAATVDYGVFVNTMRGLRRNSLGK